MSNTPASEKTTILFMAADPSDQTRLRLPTEAREIREKLRMANARDQFDFVERWAMRVPDITQAMHDTRPRIVHFAGHGEQSGALVFEDSAGKSQRVQPEALGNLFRLVKNE